MPQRITAIYDIESPADEGLEHIFTEDAHHSLELDISYTSVPYIRASYWQPAEGGYPEDVACRFRSASFWRGLSESAVSFTDEQLEALVAWIDFQIDSRGGLYDWALEQICREDSGRAAG